MFTYAARTGRLPVSEYLSPFLHTDDEDCHGKTCLFAAAETDQSFDVAQYLVAEEQVDVYHVNAVRILPPPHDRISPGIIAR